MGNCVFCGEPVGFLRRAHSGCKAKHESGQRYIVSLVEASAPTDGGSPSLQGKIREVAKASWISDADLKGLVVAGWERAVEKAFEDGVLTEQEEAMLFGVARMLPFSQAELDTHGAYTKIVKGIVLREILEGKTPQRVKVDANLPFNFQRGEALIWIFQGVDYYEQKTRRQYVGGSTGVSVRVAKGLYLRTSAFKGTPVDTTESVRVDRGFFGVTDKHVYFAGPSKAFRIRHDKIVSLKPYTDGVGLFKDGASPKPQVFITGDGWFTYNLLTNLNRVQDA
jgi:hypothetical protein